MVIMFSQSILVMLTKKERCHKRSLILLKTVRGRDRNTVKNDDGRQMVVAFGITKLNYLVVSLFCDLIWYFSYLYL